MSSVGMTNSTWPHRDDLIWPHPAPMDVHPRASPGNEATGATESRVRQAGGSWAGRITWAFGDHPLPALSLQRLLEPPAVGPGLHDVGVDREPVDHRLAKPGLGEDLGPLPNGR